MRITTIIIMLFLPVLINGCKKDSSAENSIVIGIVIDKTTNLPIAGINLKIVKSVRTSFGTSVHTQYSDIVVTTTGNDGRFTLRFKRDLEEGMYTVKTNGNSLKYSLISQGLPSGSWANQTQ